MSLRRQLLAVSLLLLSLPWAGCQYLREMESTLRTGQGMAVSATADALAAALHQRTDLIYGNGGPNIEERNGPTLVLPAAEEPLFVDGFGEDWRLQELKALAQGAGPARFYGATWENRIYLLLEVEDDDLRYSTPYGSGDHLDVLCMDALGAIGRYRLAPEGPGLVPVTGSPRGRISSTDPLRGAWRERDGGYAVELRVPMDGRCERLAVRAMNSDDEGGGIRFDSRRPNEGSLPRLVYRIAALEQWLSAFEQPGRRITVLDDRGALVGLVKTPGSAIDNPDDVFWLLRTIYRAALKNHAGDRPRERSAQTQTALSADDRHGWCTEGDANGALITAVATISDNGQTLGTVILEETTERYLALTDRATGRVLAITAAVLATAFLGLLIYASILSWRIRTLNSAAHAIAAEALSPTAFPRSRAKDELGDLSRSYADLLQQIGEYNHYLKNLARTLSHELRTPIAVIGSSLENLAQGRELTSAQEGYVGRSQDGLARLTRIVTAMSEASRIEETVQGATFEPLNLPPLLQALAEAYGSSFPEHPIAFHGPPHAPVLANGDLIAQALDKLLENAVSFTAAGSTIHLELENRGSRVAIAVSNPGPLLPEQLHAQLFEPMVSLRETPQKTHSHLGLGLAIARAIAEAHGGELQARNRDDDSGVIVTLLIPAYDAKGDEQSKPPRTP